MKLTLWGALAIGILGSAGLATVHATGSSENNPSVAALTRDAYSSPKTFQIWTRGRETACTVSRVTARPDGPEEAVSLSPECGALPSMAGVERWRVLPDETVALADGSGQVRVEFARADGLAYETFRQDAPLLAMIALD